MRVTNTEPRKQFAHNLDGLIRLLGLTRKEAAERIGVTYKLIRRFVSAGLSRPDYRSQVNLEKIKTYFALPNTQSLWQEGLVRLLLTTDDGKDFVKKFRSELERRRQEEQSKVQESDKRLLEYMNAALDDTIPLKPSRPQMTSLDKARAILESDTPKSRAFRVVVDLFYDGLELQRTGTC